MKMRYLEVWGVPSYIVDIWEKNYSPYLLPVQEEAVRDYGVLNYKKSFPKVPGTFRKLLSRYSGRGERT